MTTKFAADKICPAKTLQKLLRIFWRRGAVGVVGMDHTTLCTDFCSVHVRGMHVYPEKKAKHLYVSCVQTVSINIFSSICFE